MADQELTVPMEDEKLSDLMADDTTQETVVEETAQQQEDRQRDEKGRFTAKAETVEQAQIDRPVAEPEQSAQEQDGQIPSWRLREMREERDTFRQNAEKAAQDSYALRQQMADMQRKLEQFQTPKVEPVDFFQNPDEAFQQRTAPIEQQIAQMRSEMRLNTSRAMAVAMHGAPAIQEMEAAVEKAAQANHPDIPSLVAQMRNTADPVGTAMNWFKRDSMVQKTGGDLDAYVQKQLDEKLKDPAVLAKAMETARTQAGGQSRPSIQIPPSLNKATGSGASQGAPDDDDTSDGTTFRYAMGNRR